LIGEELTEKLFEAGYIKFEVFGALRGRSIPNSIIIIDEFQNVTDTNGKTFLTRFSDTSKVIVLGDSNQIDIKNPKDSCFAELVKFCKAFPDDEVGVVEFTDKEIVRSRLTRYFIKIFEHPDYKKTKVEVKSSPILLSENFKKDINKTAKPSWFKRFLNLFK
jgi:phosphate starvation-inducible protein PhoH